MPLCSYSGASQIICTYQSVAARCVRTRAGALICGEASQLTPRWCVGIRTPRRVDDVRTPGRLCPSDAQGAFRPSRAARFAGAVAQYARATTATLPGASSASGTDPSSATRHRTETRLLGQLRPRPPRRGRPTGCGPSRRSGGLDGLVDRRHVARCGTRGARGPAAAAAPGPPPGRWAAARPAPSIGHRLLAAGDAAGQHRGAVLQVARADLDPYRHALELPVDGAAAERGVGAVVDLDADPGRLERRRRSRGPWPEPRRRP